MSMRIKMTKEIELDNFRDIIINQFYVNIKTPEAMVDEAY